MMNGPLLPGGAESLLSSLAMNPFAVVEYGTQGFVRLKGRHVEGRSFYSCVWDSIADRVPDTVRIFRPGEYGSDAYMAALERASERAQ